MAFSKAPTFDPISYQQSFWSKSNSHPARIKILQLLLEKKSASFQEIKSIIPLATSTVSQHLRKLKADGLIEAEERFPHTYYKLNRKNCRDLAILMTNLDLEFITTELIQ